MKWNIELNIVTLERKHFYGNIKPMYLGGACTKSFEKKKKNVLTISQY